MGVDLSKYDKKLVPQHPPIAAIEPRRFVSEQDSLLLMQEKRYSYSGDDFDIKDMRTGKNIFKVDGKLGISQKKRLLDSNGKCIANLKHNMYGYSVYLGDTSDTTLFDIKSRTTGSRGSSHIEADLKNILTDETVRLVLLGHERNTEIVIFKGHPKNGGYAIAKVTRQLTTTIDTYHLAISSGVEVPIIIFMVIALDEAKSERSHSSNRRLRM